MNALTIILCACAGAGLLAAGMLFDAWFIRRNTPPPMRLPPGKNPWGGEGQ